MFNKAAVSLDAHPDSFHYGKCKPEDCGVINVSCSTENSPK